MNLRTITTTTVVLTALSSALAAQNDVVLLKEGGRLRGVTVTAATATDVSYTQGSDEKKVAAAKVRDITWGDAPEAFALAQSLEEGGKFEEAATQFLEAASNAKRPVVKEDATFRGARAAIAGAGNDAAMAQGAAGRLQEYLDAAPQGFRVGHDRSVPVPEQHVESR